MALVVVPVPDGLAHISPSTKQKIGEKNSKILKSPVVDYWSPSFTENLLTNMFVDEVYSPDFICLFVPDDRLVAMAGRK